MENEKYRLTPKGIMVLHCGPTLGGNLLHALKKYMAGISCNGIVLDDGKLRFVEINKQEE